MVRLESLPDTGTVQNYVDGRWQTPSGNNGQDVVNPATSESLAHVAFSSPSEVDDAVEAASEAFEDWSTRPVEERIQPLFELKQLLEDHQEELAELLVQEHGKTHGEAMGEIRRGIENVEVACGIPSMMQGGTLLNAAPAIDESAIRKPLGVFAAITPFNFPAMIPLWFLPYAVATGNSFVLKPSEQDPLVAQRIFELIDQAGFPDGVLQLVNGSVDTVDALLEHDDIEGISFVGSTPVARQIYEKAAANGKRVQAQGGAKNHIIVTETADLDFAAQKTVGSAFACAGERCLANDVVVVEASVYDEFVDKVVAISESQVVGNGLDEETDIGALITPEHEQSVRNYIEAGISEGAELLLDGRDVSVDGYENGNFLGPTLFGDVTTDMVITQEEVFGPVLALMPVADVDEAIDVLNQSDFGNAASLFTGSGADARKFRHQTDIGNLGVNAGTAAPMAFFHFGGRKDSFFGDLHAQGEDMIHFYTDKTIYIERWPDA
ncbi:CoA-acylating methylmalonate-semialdehyde dehydrogenase [Natronolimnohabitans sp. A-GB9]|uniref:CoA-acylating methylmalonate-semialdehyde dehydrogenase n=1 Tax=Natronolimnohabitans sp. A-GB9 TaxID=3069757 RepID=UPI0027B73FA9|nr:CoA-acylating methylmalonate-semialdehyde dehydrogenase [Natronolimnohabitans sp. A-GB9]MDQ2052689.1 CoA-acylating methylmalonate-semialdehyde dehydrogenase [Natronolimnohabitans sp. A-GB9]